MNSLLPIGENYGEVEWVAWRSDEKIDASQVSFDGTSPDVLVFIIFKNPRSGDDQMKGGCKLLKC